MTIEDLKNRNLIVLECLSGSKAYGLDTPTSDTDIKGVFVLPRHMYYGWQYIPQISNESNDEVYYELGRYLELLSLNNPNILELLNTPEHAIRFVHPLMEEVDSKKVLSRFCEKSFGKFAVSQIRKARGINKKIVNPVGKERKDVLSFCYVTYQNGAIPLMKFLELKNATQEMCGLVKIPHMPNTYGLYIDREMGYKGVLSSSISTEVSLSSIPKGAHQEGVLFFNREGFSVHCKQHKEYWNWVEKRNEVRFQTTQQHGKNYDSKNMMHTFRLLEMAIEIAQVQEVNVMRPNREDLLKIKEGLYEYDDLLERAESLQQRMIQAYAQSSLPESPDRDYLLELSFELRKQFYQDETFH